MPTLHKLIRFGVGDVIKYITYDDTYRVVKVTGIEPEGKNGKDVFDGIVLDTNGNTPPGNEVWGYHYQVVGVL
jgi:archaeosine-15-forming tRNA-guanine transglycosylase